jgi:hypothetical protein
VYYDTTVVYSTSMYVVVHYLLATRVYEPSCQLVGTVVASASVAKKEEKKKRNEGEWGNVLSLLHKMIEGNTDTNTV